MHEFLLLVVGRVADGDLGCCHACVLVEKILFSTGVILFFFFQEQICCFEIFILDNFVNTLLIALTKYLIQSSLSNNCRKTSKSYITLVNSGKDISFLGFE